jgi:hypothetical protein
MAARRRIQVRERAENRQLAVEGEPSVQFHGIAPPAPIPTAWRAITGPRFPCIPNQAGKALKKRAAPYETILCVKKLTKKLRVTFTALKL